MCLAIITHTDMDLPPSTIAYKVVERWEGLQPHGEVLYSSCLCTWNFPEFAPPDLVVPVRGGWSIADTQESISTGSDELDTGLSGKYLPGVHAFVYAEDAQSFLKNKFTLNAFTDGNSGEKSRPCRRSVIVKVLLRGPICGGLQGIQTIFSATLEHRPLRVPVVVYKEMTILRELF